MTRGRIQTVTGAIPPEELGPTLMHEHLLCDLTDPSLRREGRARAEIRLDNLWEIRSSWGVGTPGHHVLDDAGLAVAELARFRKAGGSAVVELTCEGIGPDPLGLVEVSRRTGVYVIAGTGPYVEAYLEPASAARSPEAIASAILVALGHGIGETGVRAGIIGEIGCSTPLTAAERRALDGAALAQRESGACINVHPPRTLDGVLDMLATLRNAGADLARVVVSHIDRTLFDIDSMLRVTDAGAVLEFDFFGIESSYYPFADVDLPNDGQRVRWIGELARRGLIEQVVVSQDICTLTRLRRYGGHGYAHVLELAVPLMLRRGLDQAQVDALLIGNPRRLLACAQRADAGGTTGTQ